MVERRSWESLNWGFTVTWDTLLLCSLLNSRLLTSYYDPKGCWTSSTGWGKV